MSADHIHPETLRYVVLQLISRQDGGLTEDAINEGAGIVDRALRTAPTPEAAPGTFIPYDHVDIMKSTDTHCGCGRAWVWTDKGGLCPVCLQSRAEQAEARIRELEAHPVCSECGPLCEAVGERDAARARVAELEARTEKADYDAGIYLNRAVRVESALEAVEARGKAAEAEAEAEVMDAACQSVLYGFPTGAKVDCTIAGLRYEVTVKPLPNGEKEG